MSARTRIGISAAAALLNLVTCETAAQSIVEYVNEPENVVGVSKRLARPGGGQ